MKNIKRAVVVALVGMALLLPFFSLAPVLAAPTPPDGGGNAPARQANMEQLVKSHLFYNAIGRCVSDAGWNPTISGGSDPAKSAITNWQWYASGNVTYVSPLYDTDDDNRNGTTSCSFPSTILTGFNMWGVDDGMLAACKIGFVRSAETLSSPDESLLNECVNATTWFINGDFDNPGPNKGGSTGAKNFRTYVNGLYYGKSNDSTPQWTDAQLYYLLSRSFILSCNPNEVSKDGNVTLKTPTKSNPDKETHYNLGNDNQNINVAWETSPNAYDRMGYLCKDLPKEINKYAPAFATYIKTHPNDDSALADPTSIGSNPDTTGDNPEDPEIDTCNASGNSLSWILCSVYDGLGSLSDFLLNHILEPLLHTNPISTEPDEPIYKIWSAFRVWGDVLLIFGLLAVVFGQAIGGGLVDAYTAKKVLPRLLVAAILINLSIYIVALGVDIANVIGSGIGNIMTAPLDGVSLSPEGFQLGLFAILAAVGAAATTIMGAMAFISGLGGVTGLGAFIPYLFLFVILPVLLAIIAVIVILALRQAIIMALVLVSPVAFALYCLPNTEQYFRKWWSLFVNMLLVYPIIMVIFAAADVLAYTSLMAGGTDSFWSYFLAFLLQFIPLFMIPYAFKLAGGVLGRIHEIATGHSKRGVEALKGDVRDPWSRRNRYRRMASNKFLEGRENLVGRGKGWQESRGTVGAFLGRNMSGLAGMGNYEDLRSRRNKEATEMLQNHIATGGDATARALFARQGADGVWRGTNGTVYQESDVRKAQSLYGSDPSMFQAAYAYEIGKAANDTELNETLNRGQQIMKERHIPDPGSVTLGAHWNHQQTRRELKHTKLQDNGNFVRGAQGFTQEVAENVSGYALSNMRTSTIKALRDDYAEAEAAQLYHQNPASTDVKVQQLRQNATDKGLSLDKYLEKRQLDTAGKATDVRRFVESTATALDQRMRMGGGYGLDADDKEVPLSGSQSSGPGLVSEQIDQLVAEASRNPAPAPRSRGGGQQGGQGGGQGTGGSGGGQNGGGQGPTIITPGSPGFNVPPGSLPPGP